MKTKMTVLIAVLVSVLLGEKIQTNAGETVPPNMVLIPAGSFQMGDSFNEGNANELPVHTAYVSAFYIDQYSVTKALWDDVYQWATNHGYSFDNPGSSKATNHPVQSIYWYDAVKWCNARSEKEGRTPAYYIDAEQTSVYRSGLVHPEPGGLQNDWVNWNTGFRLPTEAEWEKAARGGLNGKRFPWGDTISHSQANYYSDSSLYSYDVSLTHGYHPTFNDGAYPYTSQVDSFRPNDYGLYDMAGNVREWCWDRDGDYSGDSQTDPRGPPAWKLGRVIRGGSWHLYATNCRTASRFFAAVPFTLDSDTGFRTILSSTGPNPIQVIQTQPSQPTYGICPVKEDGKTNIVVVTHGWTPVESEPTPLNPVWVDNMTNAIVQKLTGAGQTNWQVIGYKWLTNSWTLLPQDALNAGKRQGVILGNSLSTQHWANVHLIGHSAGAALIQACSEIIKTNSPTTIVQCTFLDAFIGNDKAGLTNYGKGTDWSDSYFSRDVDTGWRTAGSLSNAYNVDVTQLDTTHRFRMAFFSGLRFDLNCYKTESTHDWPINFYYNTITHNVTLDYGSFGWPLSTEGGLFGMAGAAYHTGNNPAQSIGPSDPSCSQNSYYATTADLVTLIGFRELEAIQSTTGYIEKWFSSLYLFSGSPVWIATTIITTNTVNLVSFDARFTSTNGSQGLLSMYWDTNMVGVVDERAVQEGFQHYTFSFPTAVANTSHVFGLRLDPFTSVQSSILLTNIGISQAGVAQPFSLSITTNTDSELPVFQLTGQSGFEYTVQTSTDLVNWTPIAILANTNGVVSFIDRDSTNDNRRFYRAVVP